MEIIKGFGGQIVAAEEVGDFDSPMYYILAKLAPGEKEAIAELVVKMLEKKK